MEQRNKDNQRSENHTLGLFDLEIRKNEFNPKRLDPQQPSGETSEVGRYNLGKGEVVVTTAEDAAVRFLRREYPNVFLNSDG